MQFTTRKPTGQAAFPTILLAGVPGGGKSWAAAEATGWEHVDRAYFIELGEGVADEYGSVPGADFEIIEHDGTIGQVRDAVRWASEQPVAEGKFPMLVIDSMTEVWDLITDNAQQAANARAKRKGRGGDGEVKISIDLWNRASDTWNGIMRQINDFPGPVILTARLDLVTLMDDNGQPTKAKDFKIQAQKRLPYQVTVVMQARAPRQWTMTKIATTNPQLQLEPGGAMTFKNFSVIQLLETMGVAAGMDATHHSPTTVDDSMTDEALERSEQEAKARAEEQQRQYAQQQREEDLRDFAASLEALEKAQDVEKVRAGVAYYATRDEKKRDMAAGVLDRMEKAAQAAVQTELGAEVVEGEIVHS